VKEKNEFILGIILGLHYFSMQSGNEYQHLINFWG